MNKEYPPISYAEENYLKALFKLRAEHAEEGIGTLQLATFMNVKASSANEMLKRLKEKGLIAQKRYSKIFLTPAGKKLSLHIIRKHRLWETFLYNILRFDWTEIHEIAEELEHIRSEKLISSLDMFLGYPKYDPHGNPIPNADGECDTHCEHLLSESEIDRQCTIVSFRENTPAFETFLQQKNLTIGSRLQVVKRDSYDGSVLVELEGQSLFLSKLAADNIVVV